MLEYNEQRRGEGKWRADRKWEREGRGREKGRGVETDVDRG